MRPHQQPPRTAGTSRPHWCPSGLGGAGVTAALPPSPASAGHHTWSASPSSDSRSLHSPPPLRQTVPADEDSLRPGHTRRGARQFTTLSRRSADTLATRQAPCLNTSRRHETVRRNLSTSFARPAKISEAARRGTEHPARRSTTSPRQPGCCCPRHAAVPPSHSRSSAVNSFLKPGKRKGNPLCPVSN